MRHLRVLTVAFGLAALLPQMSAAQSGRQFKDAWFWGIKGGSMLYSSASTENSIAPLVGAEWLITRSRGGLYVSYDQAFLSTTGSFLDRDPDSTFTRNVSLTNLRRISIAAMVFPMQSAKYHPYVGLGLSLNQIGGAAFQSGFVNTTRYQIALDSVQSKKASFSPTVIGGLQMRLSRFSVFGQAAASPVQQNFFLRNSNSGQAFNFSLETGVRYNFGSSIDRAR
ncbi:MAG: hypothetical protein ABIP93_16980 [Gemmatimonadaceae bacterium]